MSPGYGEGLILTGEAWLGEPGHKERGNTGENGVEGVTATGWGRKEGREVKAALESQTLSFLNPSPDQATLKDSMFQGLAKCLTSGGGWAGGWTQPQFRQIPPSPLPWEGGEGLRKLC